MFKKEKNEVYCNNAYNEQSNKSYCYQSHDILHIGSEICSAYPNATFVPPNCLDDAMNEKSPNELSLFRVDLDNGKKLVGVYKTNEKHWIAYALEKVSGNVICFYKDSYNVQREDFLKAVSNAFPSCSPFQLNPESVREQNDIFSSGIFALYNMEVLAKALKLCDDTCYEFLNPKHSEVSILRSTIFSIKYIEGCMKSVIIENANAKVFTGRYSETEFLKRTIEEETGFKVKSLEVQKNKMDNDNYNYAILLEDENKQGVCDYLKQLAKPSAVLSVNINNTLLISPHDLNLNNKKLETLFEAKRSNDANCNLELSDLENALKEITSIFIKPNRNQKKTFVDDVKSINFNIVIGKKNFSANFSKLNTKQIKHIFAISHPKFTENKISSTSKDGEVIENISTQYAETDFAKVNVVTNNAIIQETNDLKIAIYPAELKEEEKKASANVWGKSAYAKWDQNALSSTNASYKEGIYYPTDLVHGLLAEHCSSETSNIARNSKIKPGNNVVISNKRASDFSNLGDINQYLKTWKVLGLISDKQTGYLGIIYADDEARQLVLAHRSTNFELSVNTVKFYKQFNLKQEIAGVFMGEILLHQAYGYAATSEAIQLIKNHSKYADYAFSITGHSLGGWLAEMSAYYCSRDLNYPNVKAVSFDGPGSREMMEKLSANKIIPFQYKKLNIVSYFSVPNLVNCLNKHCGTVYTVYPNITKELPSFLKKIIPPKKTDALLGNYGHDIKNILTQFDHKTGRLHYDKPETFSKVESWPSITHNDFGHTNRNQSLKDVLIQFLKSISIAGQITGLVFKACDMLLVNNKEEPCTLASIVQLALDIYNKRINHNQFWIAHKYLEKDLDYKDLVTDSLDQFQLHYVAGYQVSRVNKRVAKIEDIEENIGNYLKLLKTKDEYLQCLQSNLADQVIKLKNKYNYIEAREEISIADESTNIDQLINEMQILVYRFKLEWYLKDGYKSEQLHTNVDSTHDIYKTSKSDEVEEVLAKKPLVIINGMPKSGKTKLAYEYARLNLNNITSIYLDVSCDASSENQFEYQTKIWNERNKELEPKKFRVIKSRNEILDMFFCVLEQNLQRVLFILDNARNWSDVEKITKRFKTLETIGRIKFIITTRHDFLPGTEEMTYVHLNPDTKYQIYLPEDIKLVKLLALLNPNIKATELAAISNEIAILCENSYVSVKKDGDIVLNPLVQMTAREKNKHSSALEFLNFASEFHPSILDKSYISSHFENYPKADFNTDLKNIIYENKKEVIQNHQHLRILMTDLLHFDGKENEHFKSFIIYLLEKEYELLEKKINEINLGFENAENKATHISNASDKILALIKEICKFKQEQHSDTIKSSTHKNIIVFGPTGSGKSTIINALLGNSLVCNNDGDEGEPAEIIVQVTDNYPIIGNDTTRSQTLDVKDWRKSDTTYFDCPGFGDSRGLLFEINNTQKLRSLSVVAQNGVGIMIVISATLINGKGGNFLTFLDQLDRAFDVRSLQKNVLLVVTQTYMPIVKKYVDKLKCHYEELQKQGIDSGFLNLFINQDFENRIVFVPKVYTCDIQKMPSFFKDVQVAVNNLEISSCNLNPNSISRNYKNELSKLGFVLNEYCNYRIKALAQQVNKSLLAEIESSDKVGKDLKIYIREKTSFKETDDKNKLIQQIEKLSPGYSKDIELVSKTLEYLRQFNSTVKAHISEWGAELRTLSKHYRTFSESITVHFLKDQLVVKGLIVSVSEIDELICTLNTPHSIWIETKMFLVDTNVVWRWKSHRSVVKHIMNGTNVYVNAIKCRVVGLNQTIDISGMNGVNPGDDGGNGGKFYGQFDHLFGGKMTVDIRGGNGVDGEINIDERLKLNASSIDELKKKNKYFENLEGICEKKSYDEILEGIGVFKKELNVKSGELEEKVSELKELENFIAQLIILKGKNEEKETDYFNAQSKKKRLEENKFVLEQSILKLKEDIQAYKNATALSTLNGIRDKKLKITSKIDSMQKSLDKIIKANDEIQKLANYKDFITKTQKKVGELEKEYENAEKNLENSDQIKSISSALDDILTEVSHGYNIIPSKAIDDQKQIIDIELKEWNITKQELHEKLDELKSKLRSQSIKSQSKKMTLKLDGEEHKVSSDEIEEYKKNMLSMLNILENEQNELYKQAKDFEKSTQLFREKSEQCVAHQSQIDLIEADYQNKFDAVKKSGINLEKLKGYKRSIQDLYEVVQKEGNNLSKVLVKKDFVVLGSNEPFSEKDFKSIIGGKLLSSSKNYNKIVENYFEEKKKLFDFKEKVTSNYDNDENVKREKELRILVQDNISLNIERKLIEAKVALNKDMEENTLKMYREKLENNRKKCAKVWARNHWIKNMFRRVPTKSELDDAISLMHENLQSKVLIKSNLKEILVERTNYAEKYAPMLEEAYQSYKEAVSNYNKKKEEYKYWKKSQAKEMQPLIQILDTLLKHQDLLQEYSQAEGKAAKDLLIHDVALVSRVRRQWSDRNISEKVSHILKEIFCFNTQFLEKYRLVGSDGGVGGASGSLVFNKVVKESYPGVGGSSITLLGVYINEYSYAMLRRIREKQEVESTRVKATDFVSILQGTFVTGAVQAIKEVVEELSTRYAFQCAAQGAAKIATKGAFISIPLIGLIVGVGIFITQLIASPLIALGSCKWINGPYIIKIKNKDGINNGSPLDLRHLPAEDLKLTNDMELAARFIYNEKL